ncbi:flavin reductase family protein [Actinoplanes sp. NPDC023801]|uniref:flavin reductase family protein n=1 Tax=Actinoplanes sp. NPDC023801 TaxID=3154595 RepID=UPI0033CD164F
MSDAGTSGNRDLRDAFGRFATGVAVITAYEDGRPTGLTVNSLTSVSLDPPLLLWCLRRASQRRDVFAHAQHFGVNVLAADQRPASRWFAADRQPFDRVAWHAGHAGVPLLDGAIAHYVCRRAGDFDGGDHIIVLGEVVRFRCTDGEPLVFHSGAYQAVRALQPQEVTAPAP